MKKLFQLVVKIFILMFAFNSYGQNFVDITPTNGGQVIHLSPARVLEINLPRKASTGYIWCEANTAGDKQIPQFIAKTGDDEFIHDIVPGTLKNRMVGGSGTQVIRYIGSSAGTTVLTLELKRPWEKNNAALDQFTLTVVSDGKYTGSYTPPAKAKFTHVTSTPKGVPSKWDWRSQCTPITDQGSCGDCWAFASVATLECNILIHDGVTRDISEEFVTDCFTDNQSSGCNGGNCAHEAWLASYTGANSSGGGAVYEADDLLKCANSGQTGNCGAPYTPHETIDSYADVAGEDANGNPPDANIKAAIYNYGPVWIAVDASNWSMNYSGGIWTETGSPSTDHAVALVGWVDSASISGGGYWILRNSWGSGWGMSGYMYISYGSDYVGQSADYIVYKGGIDHAVPPIADFAASVTTSCSGVIQFTDNSTNLPTSWLWDFGDNTTSDLQNPSHTYITSGTYNVTLTTTNNYGNDSKTKSNYITINLEAAPITTGASCNGPCSETLSATGNGTLNWYDAPSGGNLINTGTTYTTPELDSTTTYYVQILDQQPVQSAGLSVKNSNGGYYSSTSAWAMVFDALNPVTINSVTVYASTTASRHIWLENSSGTVINSINTNINSGTQTVTLNFNVPAGTGYQLGTDGGCKLWRDKAGAVYPYTAAGLVSITGNTAGAANYYYYFYNWQIQAQACFSEMTPVVATINTATGIDESSASGFGIFPNPNTGKFEIRLSNLDNQDVTITMVNVIGETVMQKKVSFTNVPLQIDASGFQGGLYYIKVQTDKSTYLKKVIINQ